MLGNCQFAYRRHQGAKVVAATLPAVISAHNISVQWVQIQAVQNHVWVPIRPTVNKLPVTPMLWTTGVSTICDTPQSQNYKLTWNRGSHTHNSDLIDRADLVTRQRKWSIVLTASWYEFIGSDWTALPANWLTWHSAALVYFSLPLCCRFHKETLLTCSVDEHLPQLLLITGMCEVKHTVSSQVKLQSTERETKMLSNS